MIAHCVRLYRRFTLSFREIELLMAARGVEVSYETIRAWSSRFGPEFACRLRQRAPRPGDKRQFDEVFIKVGGARKYLWRAVDQHGNVLDILIRGKRDGKGCEQVLQETSEETRSSTAGTDQRQTSQLPGHTPEDDVDDRTPALESVRELPST
ncbi:transposase [Rhodococcus erythropolis]|uniref:transposase n=1 Tax=Rhodococcus erythropolis TaxID=1833 RepID=UPI0035B68D25